MDIPKYMSEFGLNMVNGSRFILQQEELTHESLKGFEPHIYIIGRRPRISLDATSLVFTKDKVKGSFRKQVKDKFISIPFETTNNLGTEDVIVECEYPYTHYAIRDKNGNILSNGKCALLLSMISSEFREHLDLEVLYVGQSYGKDGSRTAPARLASHSTLQGIYSEAIRKSPDQDVWMILSSFNPMLLGVMDGRSKSYQTTLDDDDRHIDKVFEKPITEKQQINFTEAALIKYFQPSFNTIYKDTFPSPSHSTYAECYDIDLNMVTVELQTDDWPSLIVTDTSTRRVLDFQIVLG
ncbi:hypothetical protein ACTOWA_04790 [Herbaspirillum seropedicae]|uniref:hypothetical protein n=1 Tax=Herbaspirillum seropedicae TaxID=964 RepID=UPI003F8D7214